ncbi:NfeD family protein [Brevifollis gellanilyticus]|uniref:Serine protease n=1 Tax=Brevifollis gellanilyticus TaxID=748831 RepID=A0A512M721_9BACT|nr:NfeD family protein [Brevifollis gellanilyticus]GEP42532.1 serine protease [Brevifollis gellanilyticus]
MIHRLLSLMLGLMLLGQVTVMGADTKYTGKVVVIPVGEDDLIARARFEFMSRTLERCTAEGAEAVIFDLDTPGGLLWDTVDLMMNDLQKLKPKSFAFVNPRALSAGAMIAVATDGIYMAPTSSAGAASPVYGNGEQMADAERAKMNSATMSMARAVAKRKGHNPAVIEAMIDMGKELKVNGVVIDNKKEILTLDAEQAIMISDGKPLFAKAIVSSLDEIKKAESLKGELVTAEPTLFELIAIWVTKYAAILILIGVAGGYLEMQAPGFGIPGFVSLAAFSLFFFGHYVAGSLVGQETAVAVAVFMLGVVLIALELTLFPGTLALGIVGFVCVMAALVFTMSGWEMPVAPVPVPADGTNPPPPFDFSLATYALGLRNFALGMLGASLIILVAARYLPETRPFRRLVLHTAAGGTLEATPAMTATRAVKSGDEGRTVSALRPYGTVEFGETRVEAMVEGGYLQSGTAVRVREISGTRIIVEGLT